MLALHRVAFAWPGGYQLAIERVIGEEGDSVTLPLSFVLEASLAVGVEPTLTPSLCLRNEAETLFESLQLREQTEYFITITVPVSLEKAKAARLASPSWPFANERLASAFRPDPSRSWRSVQNNGNETTWLTGRLNFRNHVGLANLSLAETRQMLAAEVACSKLDYFEDFSALLQDIARHIVELLVQVDAATGLRFAGSNQSPNETALLFHLRRLMAPDFLPAAMAAILRNPASRMKREDLVTPSALARDIDLLNLISRAGTLPMREGGPLAGSFHGQTPQALPETLKQDTVDIPENRFVKFVATEIELLCEQLLVLLQVGAKGNPTAYRASLREARDWQDECRNWLSETLWREIGEMRFVPLSSQLLQKREGYKEFLEAWVALQLGLRLPWEEGRRIADGIEGDLRPIYELYEYWCFFTLRAILRDLCGREILPQNGTETGDGLLKLSEDGLEINLKRGVRSQLKFNRDGLKVVLYYNRTFRHDESSDDWQGSYSGTFHPDYSIRIQMSGSETHWLHFDAKYRLDLRQWQHEVEDSCIIIEDGLTAKQDAGNVAPASARVKDQENGGRFIRGDLYKMHTYRDAILGSRGAYILFPGAGTQHSTFVRHASRHYRDSCSIPGVGAFPLRPGVIGQTDELKSFIGRVLQAVKEAVAYREETGFDS